MSVVGDKLPWVLVGVLAVAVIAMAAGATGAGPLDPPAPAAGPTGTQKTQNQIEPRTPISSLPFAISAPGSYYLTSSLTGVSGQNGITINASNVTLDLDGFTLTGGPGSWDGIVAPTGGGQRGITVHNGHVRAWGSSGLQLTAARTVTIHHVTTESNGGYGIAAGQGSLVHDCGTHNNGLGGVLADWGSVVRHCTSSNNAGIGFDVSGELSNCDATDNNSHGIQIWGSVSDCKSTSNGTHGVRVIGDGSRLDGVLASFNTGAGIFLEVTRDGVLILQSNAFQNGKGIDIDSAGNLVIASGARGNTTANLEIAPGNTLIDTVAY